MNIKHFSIKNLCFVEKDIDINEIDYFGTIQNSGFIKMKSGEIIDYVENPFIILLVRILRSNNIKSQRKNCGNISIFFIIK